MGLFTAVKAAEAYGCLLEKVEAPSQDRGK
jgi:hypothetical protein